MATRDIFVVFVLASSLSQSLQVAIKTKFKFICPCSTDYPNIETLVNCKHETTIDI